MTSKILVCWIGNTDLKAVISTNEGDGPIANVVGEFTFDEIHLLSNTKPELAAGYTHWLQGRTTAAIALHPNALPSPIDFRAIYRSAVGVLNELWGRAGSRTEFFYHLSPGTPAMAAVWILLAKSSHPATLLQSSRERGPEIADVPFDISAEFLPEMAKTSDRRAAAIVRARAPGGSRFGDIVYQSAAMATIVEQAQRVARRNLPVVIEGESGTGKELLAVAIHNASARSKRKFVAVNCGAIPPELMESEFFGHRKGSFTGAQSERLGHFREADGGTLFLDEIGEMPLPMQVKLLRALQESAVTPVGESEPVRVDVRIIAATNRSLLDEIAANRFREDLFFRLAVGVLKLPPLRDRKGDLQLLIDDRLTYVNRQGSADLGYRSRKLGTAARNVLMTHSWPGNVRELQSTLQRATLMTDDETLGAQTMRDALLALPSTKKRSSDVLGRDVARGVDLPGLVDEVKRHYIEEALSHTKHNKTRAAELLGLGSHQTLTNWQRQLATGASK
jgi:DNA-binding NtrC family response regulator